MPGSYLGVKLEGGLKNLNPDDVGQRKLLKWIHVSESEGLETDGRGFGLRVLKKSGRWALKEISDLLRIFVDFCSRGQEGGGAEF